MTRSSRRATTSCRRTDASTCRGGTALRRHARVRHVRPRFGGVPWGALPAWAWGLRGRHPARACMNEAGSMCACALFDGYVRNCVCGSSHFLTQLLTYAGGRQPTALVVACGACRRAHHGLLPRPLLFPLGGPYGQEWLQAAVPVSAAAHLHGHAACRRHRHQQLLHYGPPWCCCC